MVAEVLCNFSISVIAISALKTEALIRFLDAEKPACTTQASIAKVAVNNNIPATTGTPDEIKALKDSAYSNVSDGIARDKEDVPWAQNGSQKGFQEMY